MKTPILLSARMILMVSVIMLVSCHSKKESTDSSPTDPIVVLVTYKAQPTKAVDAVAALTKLIEEVKKEPHFINIKLHVDPNDLSNILLYEAWDDATYFNTEHMQTAHLQTFIADSRHFLSGPPELSFWKVEHEVSH